MGIVKKQLFRGDLLSKVRHRNSFVDMEENIHIHYRDLRIELSRDEFEEFAASFGKQSSELLAIIRERDYQDGQLPNANQEDVRIWTESRLDHGVKYNPRRFSLEECSDGYHLHYRNYKLLIDPVDFQAIVRTFQNVRLDEPYASTADEVLQLFEANELDFLPAAGSEPDKVLSIAVARHHLAKVRDILQSIDFAKSTQGNALAYVGQRLTVLVRADDTRPVSEYRRSRTLETTLRLTDFLSRDASSLDPDEVNAIKCQVLDLYFAVASGKQLHVETDHHLWLYAPKATRVIFPYCVKAPDGKHFATALYQGWSAFLASQGLTFIKPTKLPLPTDEQAALKNQVQDILMRKVAAFYAVHRIYLMGSALRGDMGHYRTPFAHGKMVKLGSDIDILIEIHPDRESEIPGHWKLFNARSSRGCPVYHIDQIPIASGSTTWTESHPHIPFTHHLVDAYVFLPSQGNHAEKDAFLKKFGAKVVYDRDRNEVVHAGEVEKRIAEVLQDQFDLTKTVVEPMTVSTENALFRVFTEHRDLILKLFKVSGNYKRSRVAEHTEYEARLIYQLRDRGIPTAEILTSKDQRLMVEGFPALLFERIAGDIHQRPEYDLDTIASALAHIHQAQMDRPLTLPTDFTFDDICMIWLPQFHTYLTTPGLEPEIAKALTDLWPLVQRFNPGEYRAPLYARCHAVHNHGDVKPKNVIIAPDGSAWFFDFNNAFHGPRLADVVDGAYEFSLAEKYIHLADFARFDRFIAAYTAKAPLTPDEQGVLPQWIELIGCIKFTKEVRVLLERPHENLRRRRALAIAGFVLSRQSTPAVNPKNAHASI